MRVAPRKCVYCKREHATCNDHVVPREHGGPDERWNYVPACDRCNLMLSCYLRARDGDTIAMLRWKKEQFLRSCWPVLKRSWRLLSKEEQRSWIMRGRWYQFLPTHLQKRYLDGRECKPGRLIGKGSTARWKFYATRTAG